MTQILLVFPYLLIATVGTGVGRVLNSIIRILPGGSSPSENKLRYLLTELTNGLLWTFCAFCFGRENPVYACSMAAVCSVLICVFWIDYDHMLIYNRFVLLLALFGLIAAYTDRFTTPTDHLIGLCSGGGLFALLYFGAILVLKREGMGFGDVKLAFAAGLFLGWQRVIPSVFIASVSAAIILLLVRVIHKDEEGHEYPFGPFIAVGILISMLVGAPLVDWYLSLII